MREIEISELEFDGLALLAGQRNALLQQAQQVEQRLRGHYEALAKAKGQEPAKLSYDIRDMGTKKVLVLKDE